MNYYVHYDKYEQYICRITPEKQATDHFIVVPIDTELAKNFLKGKENLSDWFVGEKDNRYELRKKEKKRILYNKVDIYPIQEISIEEILFKNANNTILHNCDVGILLNKKLIQIFYNGDILKKLEKTTRIYFTRNGDPTYLICALSINTQILDEIKLKNNLQQWPNPIKLKINHDIDDISIFAQKTESIIKSYRVI